MARSWWLGLVVLASGCGDPNPFQFYVWDSGWHDAAPDVDPRFPRDVTPVPTIGIGEGRHRGRYRCEILGDRVETWARDPVSTGTSFVEVQVNALRLSCPYHSCPSEIRTYQGRSIVTLGACTQRLNGDTGPLVRFTPQSVTLTREDGRNVLQARWTLTVPLEDTTVQGTATVTERLELGP